jgi:hypothetical protein
VTQLAFLRSRHNYLKTCRCILLTVLEREDYHLPTQLGNQLKMHSASSTLPAFIELVHKFFNKSTLLNQPLNA